MSYTPTIWQDHIFSDDSYNIRQNSDGTFLITRAGKTVQQGTPMSADNFNHLEQGVFQAIEDIGDLKSRKINGVLFDGSGDIKIRLDTYVVSDSSSSWSAAPWHKVASCEIINRVTTRALTLYAERTLHPRSGGSGILRAIIRSASTAGSVGHVYLDWEYANSEINTDNFVLVYNSDESAGKLTAELWMKITAQYETWQFKVLSIGETTAADSMVWTLYNLSSGAENYSEGTGVKVSSFMSIKNNADTATTVSAVQQNLFSQTGVNQSYLSVIVPNLFTAYKLIICNITTSKGSYSCMLPMQYIKSVGDNRYIVATDLIFVYDDDNTMTVRTGFGQSNPTIYSIDLIAVY